jgi:hypothetical protein
MVRMFCTLTEAANKLETAEADLEAMLKEGMLREFRDGPHRFLKITDLKTLAAGEGIKANRKPSPGSPSERDPSQPVGNVRAAAPHAGPVEIRLPATAAVVTKAKPPHARTAGPAHQAARSAASQSTAPQPERRQVSHASRSQGAGRPLPIPAFHARRATPQVHEMSLGQWIWAGLVDDRPHTILVLLFMVVVVVCGIAGAAYLVSRML